MHYCILGSVAFALLCLPNGPRYDKRDAEDHAAIVAILAELPEDHPAQIAYSDHDDTIRLTHLVADRPELSAALKEVFLDGYHRSLQRWGAHLIERCQPIH